VYCLQGSNQLEKATMESPFLNITGDIHWMNSVIKIKIPAPIKKNFR